ncbi:MAG TPA: Spy/CpxP family protein refolding chaperone [Burkholderiales bacterium]|nr:Spy/CpxP family protein refolding chaperone [Burkholderiales bacterium]
MQGTRKLVLIGLPLLLSAVAIINPGFAQSADTDREDQSVASARQDSAGGTDATRHDPIAFAQKRLNHLKSKLAITAEQEPQWSAFSATVMQQMEQMKAAHQGKRPHAQTVPERIDRQVAWMKERAAAFEAVGQAAKELYATLSPEQRQIADQRLMRWHARRGS